MKGITRDEYGPPEHLRFEDIDEPVPGEGQVLIKVTASSMNPYDWHLVRGEPYLVRISYGLRHPKTTSLGIDVAGTVTALGEGVTDLAVGDEVFGCGVGTFAEYALARTTRVARKPSSIGFEAAAAIPCAGVTAIQSIRDKGAVHEGQHVLVNGASGGVGTFAVQVAKALGARVTGVCSTKNLDLVRSLGADAVVDYTTDDFARGAQRYDVVLDTVGNRSLGDLRRVLTGDGTLVLSAGAKGKWLRPVALMAKGLVVNKLVHHRIVPVMADVTTADLTALADLVGAGSVTPVIDRTYALSECAEAVRYSEDGHARGKVVIAV